MEAQIELADLEREMKGLDPAINPPHDLRGRTPTTILAFPTSGRSLLQRIEEVFGRGRFDRFLRRTSHARLSQHHDGPVVSYLRDELFGQDDALARR